MTEDVVSSQHTHIFKKLSEEKTSLSGLATVVKLIQYIKGLKSRPKQLPVDMMPRVNV